jgi:ABC-type siderophore export system fused ATPase/permease subunit
MTYVLNQNEYQHVLSPKEKEVARLCQMVSRVSSAATSDLALHHASVLGEISEEVVGAAAWEKTCQWMVSVLMLVAMGTALFLTPSLVRAMAETTLSNSTNSVDVLMRTTVAQMVTVFGYTSCVVVAFLMLNVVSKYKQQHDFDFALSDETNTKDKKEIHALTSVSKAAAEYQTNVNVHRKLRVFDIKVMTALCKNVKCESVEKENRRSQR